MQLGLLGPADGDAAALEGAARFLFQECGADRVVYLGIDDALDNLVEDWAHALVGPDAEQEALFDRATEHCLHGDPEQIRQFIASEHELRRLRVLESLPGEATRSVELMGGKLLVMVYDKASLDEEDIVAATMLVFGKSEDALIKRVGRRWFLSPGPVATSGAMLLDDSDGSIMVTRFDPRLKPVKRERLSTSPGARLRVTST